MSPVDIQGELPTYDFSDSLSYDFTYNPPSEVSVGSDTPTGYVPGFDSLAVAVLDHYGIPVMGSAGGALEGLDIRGADALGVIKASLAQEFPGHYTEVYCNENGVAEFVNVGEEVCDLDIRYSMPSAKANNPVELVVVRGGDIPPKRKVLAPIDGLKNLKCWSYGDSVYDACTKSYYQRYLTCIYDDPREGGEYKDEIDNLYDVKAWENIIGYIKDVHIPDDMDVAFDGSGRKLISLGDLNSIMSKPHSGRNTEIWGCLEEGSYREYDPVRREYADSDPWMYFGPISLGPILDEFGTPIIDGVDQVFYTGRKIESLLPPIETARLSGFSAGRRLRLTLGDMLVYSFSAGTNYVWELTSDGVVKLYFRFHKRSAPVPAYPGQQLYDYYVECANGNCVSLDGESNGVRIHNVMVSLRVRKPGILITSKGRSPARRGVKVTYRPVVIVDPPPPIAVAGAMNGTINQREALQDRDPRTTQRLYLTDQERIKDFCGNVLELNFPWLKADNRDPDSFGEGVAVAEAVYAMAHDETTFSTHYICGPNSEPKLGAVGPDGNIVNSISYSYQDGSQYLINVETGPKWAGIGGGVGQPYYKATETISREGRVTQVLGHGLYVVDIPVLGSYIAINFTVDEWEVGDFVNVEIRNNPIEA